MMKAKVTGAMLLAAVWAVGLPGTVWAQAQGSSGTAPAADSSAAPAAADAGGLGDGEKAAIGCGIGATGAMAATYAAGPSEITLLWGGGMLVPSTSITLALALLGQIGASSCAIGAVATPTVLWFYDQSGNIAAKIAQVSSGAGQRVMEASTHVGSTVLAALGIPSSPDRQVAEGLVSPVQ